MSSSTVLLFAPGPNPAPPAKPWRADDFVAVNDQVRGGSSQSHMTVIQKNDRRNTRGEIEFSGFLDTLTLGGAGFASQAYENSFQVPLTRAAFSGLRLVVRRPVPEGSPTEEPIPGGGKAPVSMFNLNLKTEKPARRQDGRRESSIVWEWNFELPGNQTSGSAQGQGPNSTRINDKLSNDEFLVFDSTWDDFQATFRGRPADPSEAGELKPEKTVEWSIMARSNFQSQSGPFALRIHSLSGIKKCEDDKYYDKMEKRGLGPEESASTVGPARRRSGEYYGFALFILATVLYVVWMIWGLTPDWLLRKVGVGWYPNREWAYLVPAWSLVAVLGTYAGFISLNLYNTPDAEEVRTVTDSHANILSIDSSDKHPLAGLSVRQTGGTDGPLSEDIYDLPPGIVSRELYLD